METLTYIAPPGGEEAAALAALGSGIALVPARTSEEWFHRWVFGRADAALFLRQEPAVLAAYGARNALALRNCGLPGYFIALCQLSRPRQFLTPAIARQQSSGP